jgi:glucose-6-phosphate-specific signal transduction histidine kinase
MECSGLTLSALSLIKELTEENERLRAEVSVKKKLLDKCVDLEDKVKADTVRKMHSEIEARCIKGGIYPAFVARTIDQIAKEIIDT